MKRNQQEGTQTAKCRASWSPFAKLLILWGVACGLATAIPALAADPVFTARDQGNGEILLEWQPQANAVGYRVERTAWGVSTVSMEAGDHLNAMDFAGVAAYYGYRLLARTATGTETEVARLSYGAPAYVLSRVKQAAGRPPQLRSALGTNLSGITYFATQVPFVNVMKSASAWISGDSANWDNKQPLDVDANGWVRSLAPGQVARTLTLREIGDHYPAGRYLVRYKGEGTLNFGMAARVVNGSEQPGSLQIDVTPDNLGVYLYISATNPVNYLRDIEIIMPGGICEGDPFTHAASRPDCGSRRFLPFAEYSNSILFYPVFLERLRSFSVLRFMDWMMTNGNSRTPNPVINWSERTPVLYRTWTKASGAPVEIMIALANKIGAHPWFNMPHQSTDAYAQNFALAVKSQLDPALGVYTEYSNEVWNGIFPQYAYAVAQGAAQIPPIDNMQFHALRSRAVGNIFENTLGPKRVITVLAAQATNAWTATHGLDYLKSRFGASAAGIDAVAIAPYFSVTPNPGNAATYVSMTLNAFLDYVSTTVLPASASAMASYAPVTAGYGVRLISYEGGQHMVGIQGAENNVALNTLFDSFNRDPRIRQIYLDYLASWRLTGGELFVHFTDVGRYTKYGDWGALEYISQPRSAAPKFDALQTFIEQNPVWWVQ